jgi:PTH1 family peptidyl-tRNA hydrolase
MKLIVGLGNPGEKYINNRHNVGHLFAEYLAEKLSASAPPTWKYDKYLMSDICTASPDVVLAKPATYMNKSGEAVRKLMEKWSLTTENLMVVHDDLDIPLGKFRIVEGYGPKLHNGVESIENHLHKNDFVRVRIGVDNRTPENRIPGIDYVLQDFTAIETQIIPTVFSEIFTLLKTQKMI